MSVRSGQSIVVLFTTRAFSTGSGTNATGTPTGTLYVNGVANGASVTVANVSTGLYTASVTLPTLALNDEVQLIVSATVSGVTDSDVIWGDTKDFFAGSIPDVAAGGAGGLFIAGSNAATTFATLTVTGAVAFQSTVTVSGLTTLTGLTTGALSCTTLTASGAVAFQSTFATTGTTTFNAFTVTNALTVSGTTTLSGAVTASNVSNNIVGISLAANQHVIVDSGTVTTVTNQLTISQIATGIFQDTTAGDFTVPLSFGKSVMNGVTLGTGLTVARCTLADALTTNNDKTGYDVISFNSHTTVGGKDWYHTFLYTSAIAAGQLPTGAGTGTEVWQDFGGTTAVTFTVDANGNRTGVYA